MCLQPITKTMPQIFPVKRRGRGRARPSHPQISLRKAAIKYYCKHYTVQFQNLSSKSFFFQKKKIEGNQKFCLSVNIPILRGEQPCKASATNIMMPVLIICWPSNWSPEKKVSGQDHKGERDLAESFAWRKYFLFSFHSLHKSQNIKYPNPTECII